MRSSGLSWPRIAGHAAALAAGVGLAFLGSRPAVQARSSNGNSHAAADHVKASLTGGGAMRSTSNQRETTPRSPSEIYRQAWNDLLERPNLKPQERRSLLNKLLAEWAEEDLDAALEAAAQDKSDDIVYGVNSVRSPRFAAFQQMMIKDPERFWPVLKESRFGLVTAELRDQWIQTTAANQPQVLLNHLNEMPPLALQKSVEQCLERLGSDPSLRSQLISELAELPDTPENRGLWQTAGKALANQNPRELLSQIADSASEGERRMLLAGFTEYLTHTGSSASSIRKQFDQLPDAVKKEAALAIVNRGTTNQSLMAVTGYLLEKEDWEAVQKSVAFRLHEVSKQSSRSKELAEWGQSLPERKETEDLYRCSMRGYIFHRPEEAKNMITAMPSGWKRDNALLEYINGSLNYRSNETEAVWAIGQIENPAFKSSAQNRHTQWLEKKKKK